MFHVFVHKTFPGTESMWFFKQNSNRLVMCSNSMVVLLWSSGSNSSLFLMMVMADSMGTDVKNAKTSYEVMYFVGCNLIPLTCCTKSPVFLMWCGDFPNRGLRILESSLATS